MKNSFFQKLFNASILAMLPFVGLIAPIILGFCGLIYGLIFFWFFRMGHIIGWILAIAVMVVVSGFVAVCTHILVEEMLVCKADDHVGIWKKRHKDLTWKITVPITVIMFILVATYPFTSDFFNDIAFKLCYRRVPGFIHLLVGLWFTVLPITVAFVAEILLFKGKSEAIHDKSNALRARRVAAKQKVWDLCVSQYGIPASYMDVKNGKFPSFDIPKLIAASNDGGQRMYYYGDDCYQLKYSGAGSVRVKNSERIDAIETILRTIDREDDSLTCIEDFILDGPSYVNKETGYGKYLQCIYHCFTGKIFPIGDRDRILLDAELPRHDDEFNEWFYGQDVKAVSKFMAQRVREMESLILERMRYYTKEYRIIKTGLDGELAVKKALDMHDGAFFVMYGLRMEFPKPGGGVSSVETDALVFSPTGVYAIEIKNYGESGGYKIVVDSSGNWYKVYPARGKAKPKREQIDNPFAQNDRHASYLSRLINETLGRDMSNRIEVENIIVLANDTVDIENDPAAKQTLTRVGNLYNHISQNRQQVLTMDELEKIKAVFESRALPELSYPMYDYSDEFKRLTDTYKGFIATLDKVGCALEQCVTDHPELIADFDE